MIVMTYEIEGTKYNVIIEKKSNKNHTNRNSYFEQKHFHKKLLINKRIFKPANWRVYAIDS